MTAIELTLDDVRRDADAVHAWLWKHDLNPNETAPGIRVQDGEVTATVWLRNSAGERYLVGDKATGWEAAHRSVTVPLRAPVPYGLGTVIP